MKKHLQQRRTAVVAFAIAVLLSLQALFGSAALAGTVANPTLDAFGNPLCITHMDAQDPASAPGKERSLAPDCCTLACGVAVGMTPDNQADAVLFNPLAQPSQRLVAGHAVPVRPVHDDLPGHPRGPPATA
ncbi:hypothetical protein [Sinorhizobium sp. RAC02]|uniref:hypothetical protein n=1 Tax=Sinorhizobium sp. RAC02 TaxID=1842534 RepID=UPI0008591EC5|nr:hypothetical protein [Sinorhizobium sp. RAC02]AOF94035.1 hypothetical protein BSY16_4049 [Sinorhizobium sp. RAC02]